MRSQRLLAGVLMAAYLGLAVPAAAGAHPRTAGHGPKRGAGRGTSTNWSGYAVDGTNATDVIGTWVQPGVADNCASGASSWSSPWVGIDGDTSNTVEQIGTDSDCQNGTPFYYAWWEMYPKGTVTIPSITVTPGDVFTGEVKYASGAFTLTLTNVTTHTTFSTIQTSSKATRSSVEWIMEGPSNGLLTDFGSVGFSGASATIGGQAGALDPGVFSGATAITMVSKKAVQRAVPSSPPSNGAFSVAWQHS